MPDEKPFVHLHVHTEYSLLDGLSPIKKLVKRAAEIGMPSLAITDHGAMFGVIDFYRAAQEAGIKPIIGMETYITPWGRRMDERDPVYYHLLLLAKNQTGYQNLLHIASQSQLKGYYYHPRIDHDFLQSHSEGLIATSGCLGAEIPGIFEEGREEDALKMIGWHQDVFGKENFFLELQSHQIPELKTLNHWLVENQTYAGTPLVATNDVHYVLEEDYDAHDTLLCIQMGKVKSDPKRMRFSGPTFHLRSAEEMWRLFADVPESLYNTLRIAEMCDVNLDSHGYHLPVFPVPEGYDAESYLRFLCERGLTWRYGEGAADPAKQDRLDYELRMIHQMGFDTYFLIVWDLCEFARHADIWWNVRGSGAGSLAAYCLGITNLDPLTNSLLFERFLNPGRVSMPDIDMDFPEDRRAEMIQYCAQKYGEDKVAAIITFGTMGSKAAIRDVGRALDMPLPEVDRIARLIPSGAKPVKFKDALGDDPEMALPELKEAYAKDETAHTLIDAARQLEGITRHASTHAAGVIVADRPLVDYVPLHRPTKGTADEVPVGQVTQFDMETSESLGLLKIDFLGLSTLTIMRRACDLIAQQHGVHFDLSNIPYRHLPDDPDTNAKIDQMFAMIGRGETIGVFQLESQGMRRMLTDMRPQKFENIVAAVALYRPGPLEYIPMYNRRLHGEEKVEYKHPKLVPILEDTYGIIIYQESIMRIGADLFGYSLGEADLMRRAVSKKKKDDLLKHRQIFMERGPEHGVSPEVASAIFDDIEFFARYGFNLSHAADYAMMTCQTAYLKCHYPHEYMAALMSVHHDDSAKVGLFAADCHRMGIEVLPPTVNGSQLDFSIEKQRGGQRAVRFGLGAIKNLGTVPAEHIIAQRNQGGPFRDLDDFCRRVDTRIVNKRALESLIKVGTLDEFAPRPVLLSALDRIISFSSDLHKAKDSGQISLFGDETGVDFGAQESILAHLHDVESVSQREMLNWEKELVGLYVTDHPLSGLRDLYANSRISTSADLVEAGEEANGKAVTVAGLVASVRKLTTKKGDMMAILTLEDVTGTVGAVMFPRTWEDYRQVIEPDAVVIVQGKADTSRGDLQIIVESVSQEMEIATLADEVPQMDMKFSWLEDEPGPEPGESPAPEQTAPPAEARVYHEEPAAPPARVPSPQAPPNLGPTTDQEMPGWLEAEMDNNGWSPKPDIEYSEAGYVQSIEKRQAEATPPAASTPKSEREPLRRPRPQPPQPAPEPPPGRMLTLHIERTGDPAKDKRRLQNLHGRLIQVPGHDHFRFVLHGGGAKAACMNFPQHPIEINDEVLNMVIALLGEEHVEVESP